MRLSSFLLATILLAACSPTGDEATETQAPPVPAAPVPAESEPITPSAATIRDIDWTAFAASAPEVLRGSLVEADGTCRSDGGRIEVGAGGVRSADINADGKPDYFVDYSGGVGCAGAASAQSPFCGSAGRCGYDVFVSQGSGYVRQEFLLQGPELRETGGRIEVVDGGGKVLRWTGSRVDVAGAR